jgi:DNA-3-methyladenine glycosylase
MSRLAVRPSSLDPWRAVLPEGFALSGRELELEAETAARELIGCYLVSTVGGQIVGGRIVETEAYLGTQDPASHAAERIGRTARNAPMFRQAGTAYVYFIYGMHWCFNVVTGQEGDPQAVLIRALEPSFGRITMQERRGRGGDLTSGPGRLCKALGIDGSLNGRSIGVEPLFLVRAVEDPDLDIEVSGRVGVRRAEDWPLRFFLRGHPDVSRGKHAPPAARLPSS